MREEERESTHCKQFFDIIFRHFSIILKNIYLFKVHKKILYARCIYIFCWRCFQTFHSFAFTALSSSAQTPHIYFRGSCSRRLNYVERHGFRPHSTEQYRGSTQNQIVISILSLVRTGYIHMLYVHAQKADNNLEQMAI